MRANESRRLSELSIPSHGIKIPAMIIDNNFFSLKLRLVISTYNLANKDMRAQILSIVETVGYVRVPRKRNYLQLYRVCINNIVESAY